uniref:GLRK_5 protein n=1 Tax=Fopius arisanus TaxID=64838 RepID=A0A0C9QP64_9HYME
MMKLMVILILLHSVNCDEILEQFTRDYYRANNVRQIIVFACWNDFDAFHFTRNVMQLDMTVSFIPIPSTMDLIKILQVNYFHVGVMLDLDCSDSGTVLEEFSRKLTFNETYLWLLFTGASAPPNDRLRHLPLSVDTEMTVANREKDKFVLYDVYNPSYRHNGAYNITYKGQWIFKIGLNDVLTQYKYKRRGNFQLLPLNFSIVLTNPPKPDFETYITTPINRQLDTMSRYHYSLVLLLRDIFNFTIKLHNATTWGYLSKGSFNGLLGDMADKLIDISATPFQYKNERFDVAEFTVETLLVKAMFLFRHPKDATLRNNFLKPFTNDIWWMILAVGTVYWISLWITVEIQIYYNEGYLGRREARGAFEIPASESGLIALAALSQQGLSEGPQIISGRIVFLSLFLWALLLFQFYSASIVGSLLTSPPRTINTIKNLSDSQLEAGAEDIPWMYDYFNIMKTPSHIELYQKKIKPNSKRPKGSFWTAVDGMKKVKKGGFAFYIDTATGYNLAQNTLEENEICELHEMPMITWAKVTLLTAKRSPFKKMIIYGLRQIVQHGLMIKQFSIWYTPRPKCPESYSSKPVPVGLKEFIPAIFLLFIGISFAFFVLFIEFIHFWRVEGRSPFKKLRNETAMNETPEDIPEFNIDEWDQKSVVFTD